MFRTKGHIPTRYSPVRHCSEEPFDLHVLGLPPAFALSQDQTLRLSETTDQTSPIPQQDRLALVCVVLDEFPQIVAQPKRSNHIHGVFKRPQSQSVVTVRAEARRQTTAACVSLSNLQCQRPRPADRPALGRAILLEEAPCGSRKPVPQASQDRRVSDPLSMSWKLLYRKR